MRTRFAAPPHVTHVCSARIAKDGRNHVGRSNTIQLLLLQRIAQRECHAVLGRRLIKVIGPFPRIFERAASRFPKPESVQRPRLVAAESDRPIRSRQTNGRDTS